MCIGILTFLSRCFFIWRTFSHSFIRFFYHGFCGRVRFVFLYIGSTNRFAFQTSYGGVDGFDGGFILQSRRSMQWIFCRTYWGSFMSTLFSLLLSFRRITLIVIMWCNLFDICCVLGHLIFICYFGHRLILLWVRKFFLINWWECVAFQYTLICI